MLRTHSNLFYASVYALIFFVIAAVYVVLSRFFRDYISEPPMLWFVFAGLGFLVIAPAYVIGQRFVRAERRGMTRREGFWLAISMASMSLVVTFASLSVTEAISAQSGTASLRLFTSFGTVPAFTAFWVGYSLIVALPMGGLLWLANRRAVKKLDETIDETFS